MKQQGFKPDVFVRTRSIYDSDFVEQARRRGRGHVASSRTRAVRRGRRQRGDAALPVLARSRWSPAPTPNYFGLYAWSAARLFVERAVELGGKLTRKSLLDARARACTTGPPTACTAADVGRQGTAECWGFIQLNGGRWVPGRPAPDSCCGPLLDTVR